MKQKVRVFGIPKTNLVGFNKLQAQIVIIDPKPHQNTYIYFFYNTIENSPMDLSRKSQTSANTSEFDPVEVRNLSRRRHESLSKVQGRESLIFQTYATFSVDFPNTYNVMCSPMLLIHFFCYFGKRKRFLPPGAYAFLSSSVHVLHCLSRFPKKKTLGYGAKRSIRRSHLSGYVS